MEKISFDQALRTILENVRCINKTEKVPTVKAVGRVLARDVIAPIDLPPQDRAAVDGYAVRYEDTAGASKAEPKRLKLMGRLTAGELPGVEVKKGECLQVTTGSVMPPGADAVVLVEHARAENGTVYVETPVEKYAYVLRKGEDIPMGKLVFRRGRVLRSQDVGALSGLGIAEVEVLRRPKVGIIVTGSELLSPEEEPEAAKTYDVNSYTLISEISRLGAEPVWYGIARDGYEEISARLEKALSCDIVVATGGTGIGSLGLDINMQREFAQDIFPFLLQRRGELLVYGVRSIPGKPLAFGKIDGKPVFALPGWPMSVMITFHFYVKPVLGRISGVPLTDTEREVRGVLTKPIHSEKGITKFTLVKLIGGEGTAQVEPLALPKPPSAARSLSAVVEADGVVVVPEDVEEVEAGSEVRVKLL